MNKEIRDFAYKISVEAVIKRIKHSPPSVFKTLEALRAIRYCIWLDEPIPKILKPYVLDACNSSIEQLGRPIKKANTKAKWIKRIQAVEDLRIYGYTVDNALRAVADKACCSVDTLERERRKLRKEYPELCDGKPSLFTSASSFDKTSVAVVQQILSRVT